MSKVILVTGANAGIGFELTRQLAEKGHTTYLAARNDAAGKQAAETLHKQGLATVKPIHLDVTQPPTIAAAAASISGAEGRLDALINNAGIAKFECDQNATTVAVDTVRAAMETNLYGLIQTTQTLLPLLRASPAGAAIVNVSTDMASNAYQARPEAQLHTVAYNTSKAAMNSYSIALAHALAHALRGEGIKVNVVTPGFTSTKLNGFRPGGKTPAEGAAAIVPWALLEKDGPTGLFVDWNGKEFPW